MATYTDAELLESVREGINTIASGAQSYKVGDRVYERADLGQLMSLEKTLSQRIKTAAGGGRTLAEF